MRVHSLTTRFLLVLVLCTAAPFLAFGLYVRDEVREREDQRVVSYLPKWAKDMSETIATRLDNAVRVGLVLAGEAETYVREANKAFEDNLLGNVFGWPNPEFDMVILADAAGKVDMAIRRPGLDEHRQSELDALQPRSVAHYPWFQAINRPNGMTKVWVAQHTSPFLHRSSERRSKDPNDYSIGVALAVQMRGGAYGVLFILLNLKYLQQKVDELCRFLREDADFAGAEVFICDADGHFVAHSDRQKYDEVLPESLREALKARTGHAFFTDGSGDLRGIGFAALSKKELGPDFPWRIGLTAPVVDLFAASREFGRWLLLIVPLIALLLVVLAVLSSRAIVRPVRLLSAATEQIAGGDLTTRVEVRGGDELADLGHAFNTMAEDLAEKREQLRVAERQAAWAEMARQIAHEIKNPLTPMRMGAQMLLRAQRSDDPRADDLSERLAKNVIQQTEALDRIASDFQQFAGSPVRNLEVVPADRMLRGVEELLASMVEESSIDLAFEPGADGAWIEVDVQEMRRVFLNLIHNAIQACGNGGAIRIVSAAGGDTVGFRVEDEGPGIPEETRARLFEPYFTTKTSGTGLGLAISRRILEAHHGEIQLLSSSPPKTVFLVTLPRVPAPESNGSGEPDGVPDLR